ncbi:MULTISPECIES: porin family protein [unclassified Siphonobacter]|uniref:porin family protein n=1 Tax=unclassified Siphonobacter TaxID=2635712 RepID=UPI000CB71544|nr:MULTISPECIES: porin family protein [unclassified Siphonobacter]MDQ1086478.1 hypothetical protein [Siphonobacter sp. SORGH_AS_1065]PKK36084.1 hypothetical protein BWI96_13795 [Siphonobacter sp. SORGH_AS_0500]
MKTFFKKSCKISQKNGLLGLFFILSFSASAQYRKVQETYPTTRGMVRYRPVGVQMGFKLSPFISGNRLESRGNYNSFDNNGAVVRMSLGPIADIFFSEKYAFSTGLWYTVKGVHVRNSTSFLQDLTPPGTATSSLYNLQYLQIPLTFKLLTNEVADRLRLFMQFGGVADIKLAEKAINAPINALYIYNESKNRSRAFGFGDFNLLLAGGGEYALSGSDALVFGISYQRGLINIYRDNDLSIKNNCFFLDLAYKF